VHNGASNCCPSGCTNPYELDRSRFPLVTRFSFLLAFDCVIQDVNSCFGGLWSVHETTSCSLLLSMRMMILKISFAHFSTLHSEQGSIRTKLLACLYNLMQTNKRRDREVMKSTLCFESCKLELFGNCLACFLCPGPTLPKPY
jgi:hypothetical protein